MMDQSNILVGLPWYSVADYEKAKVVMADGTNMPDTFEQWQEMQMRVEADAIARGRAVKRVYIIPEEFQQWCAAKDRPPDSAGRLAYVTEVATVTRETSETGKFDLSPGDGTHSASGD
jgi:hypothetical protein